MKPTTPRSSRRNLVTISGELEQDQASPQVSRLRFEASSGNAKEDSSLSRTESSPFRSGDAIISARTPRNDGSSPTQVYSPKAVPDVNLQTPRTPTGYVVREPVASRGLLSPVANRHQGDMQNQVQIAKQHHRQEELAHEKTKARLKELEEQIRKLRAGSQVGLIEQLEADLKAALAEVERLKAEAARLAALVDQLQAELDRLRAEMEAAARKAAEELRVSQGQTRDALMAIEALKAQHGDEIEKLKAQHVKEIARVRKENEDIVLALKQEVKWMKGMDKFLPFEERIAALEQEVERHMMVTHDKGTPAPSPDRMTLLGNNIYDIYAYSLPSGSQ